MSNGRKAVTGLTYHIHVSRKNSVRFKWQLKTWDNIIGAEGTGLTRADAQNKASAKLKELLYAKRQPSSLQLKQS